MRGGGEAQEPHGDREAATLGAPQALHQAQGRPVSGGDGPQGLQAARPLSGDPLLLLLREGGIGACRAVRRAFPPGIGLSLMPNLSLLVLLPSCFSGPERDQHSREQLRLPGGEEEETDPEAVCVREEDRPRVW